MTGSKHPRIARERKTVAVMIALYCGDLHGTSGLCSKCQELLDYAWIRLDRCQFQEGKTTCAKCPVHCFKPEMRTRVREVMRYSGPRMLFQKPLLAFFHLIDGLRKKPLPG
jgi:hypothetical protein